MASRAASTGTVCAVAAVVAGIALWIVARANRPPTPEPAAAPPSAGIGTSTSGQVALAGAPTTTPPPMSLRNGRGDPEPTPDPFARLCLLTPAEIARLVPGRDFAVAEAEASIREVPAAEPPRAFCLAHVQESIARHQAIRNEVRRGMVYRDDFTFGTNEGQWFQERGAEMVRVQEGNVWGLVLLEDGRYPELVEARRVREGVVERVVAARTYARLRLVGKEPARTR